MRNVLHESWRENQKTFYVKQLFFPENRVFYNTKKFGEAREATNDNVGQACCMVDKQGYMRALM
jgi:hypothetical protein